MKTIEIIARALIIKDNKILSCKTVTQGNYFLPGGHVEFGESAKATLVREMHEEAHAVIKDIEYLGLFEHSYGEHEDIHHEINIIYTAQIEDENVVSQEAHITFEWIPIEEFSSIKFLPKVFQDKIVKYFSSSKPIYLSTLLD